MLEQKKGLSANGMFEIKTVDIDPFNQYPTICISISVNTKLKTKKLHLYLEILTVPLRTITVYPRDMSEIMGQIRFLTEE